MREAERTTRERITDYLRQTAASPSGLASEFDITPDTAVEHVRHVAHSLDGTDERVVVAPPQCRDCGFDAFDDPANRPSRCPECKSESIEEPAYRIDPVS